MIIDGWELPSEFAPSDDYVRRTIQPTKRPPAYELPAEPPSVDQPIGHDRWFAKVTLPPKRMLDPLTEHIERRTGLKRKYITNSIWYPPGGYMGWHTNSDLPGIRAYVIYNDQPGSIFRWVGGEEAEPAGWIVRLFEIPKPGQPRFWHCIQSKASNRISVGMLLTADK